MVNMTTLRHATRATLLTTLCFSAACVVDEPMAGETGKNNGKVQETKGELYPLAEGNTWTYRVTGDGEKSEKVVTVEAEEEVGGDGPNADKHAFKLVTKEGDDKSVAWQGVDGKKVVRYREQGFSKKTGEANSNETWDPPRVQVDGSAAHTKRGATWMEEAEHVKQEDEDAPESETESAKWLVDGVDQEVTVPAGTFKALVLRRVTDETKTYWFVKGVGKVKEAGKKTEELTEYKIAGEGGDEDGRKSDAGKASSGKVDAGKSDAGKTQAGKSDAGTTSKSDAGKASEDEHGDAPHEENGVDAGVEGAMHEDPHPMEIAP